MKNRKGFTLIEILGAITLLGILSIVAIVSVNKVVNRGKKAQREQQEKSVAMATESYVQSHKSVMPKTIGEKVTIPLSTLKNNEYLKENIKNSNGEDCMEKSFVTVYKESKDKYVYTPHIYCGDEVVPADEVAPLPSIQILFTDASGEENNNIFENVSEAKIILKFSGGTENGNPIVIDGYNYTISTSTVNSSSVKEVFNSGTLSGNGETEITIEKLLKDYIDVTKASHVYIKATVRNVKGGVIDETVSSDGSSASGTYQDTTSPYCVELSNQANGDNDWVNVYSTKKSRKITATCSDGGGSGCIRSTFTSTWPNKNQKSAEFAYIQVKDNAKNTNVPDNFITADPCSLVFTDDSCRVRVNVDLERPKINLSGFKRNSGGGADGGSALNGAPNQSTETAIIQYSQYKDLVNNWMNAANYPYGVVYNITVTDDIHLYSWKFETNPAGINNRSSGSYTAYNVSNPDGVAETKFPEPDLKNMNCGSRSATFTIALVTEGMRNGKLTVKDKAGNETIFFIQADIDRTVPTIPTTSAYRWQNNNTRPTANSGLSGYTLNTWLSGKVFTMASGSTDAVSNGIYYQFTTTGATTNERDARGNYRNIEAEGVSTIQYRACDAAGNCGAYNNSITIKLDRSGPTCTITKTGSGRGGASGVISCDDHGMSGCRAGNTSSFSGLKGSTNYTLYDNLGNGRACHVPVSSYDCDCYSYACGSYVCGSYVCGQSCIWGYNYGAPTGYCQEYRYSYCDSYCTAYCTGCYTCYR